MLIVFFLLPTFRRDFGEIFGWDWGNLVLGKSGEEKRKEKGGRKEEGKRKRKVEKKSEKGKKHR